jgi:hypothetical protein
MAQVRTRVHALESGTPLLCRPDSLTLNRCDVDVNLARYEAKMIAGSSWHGLSDRSLAEGDLGQVKLGKLPQPILSLSAGSFCLLGPTTSLCSPRPTGSLCSFRLTGSYRLAGYPCSSRSTGYPCSSTSTGSLCSLRLTGWSGPIGRCARQVRLGMASVRTQCCPFVYRQVPGTHDNLFLIGTHPDVPQMDP